MPGMTRIPVVLRAQSFTVPIMDECLSAEEVCNIAILERAQFSFELCDLGFLLNRLFALKDPEFKCLPAYGCYLMIRFFRKKHEDEDLANLLACVQSKFEEAHKAAKTLEVVAFWMANTMELVMALRWDEALCGPASELGVWYNLTLCSYISNCTKAKYSCYHAPR